MSFTGQQNENGLRDFFSEVRIAYQAQGTGMHKVKVSSDQGMKRGFGTASRVVLNELPVVHVSDVFTIDISTDGWKADKLEDLFSKDAFGHLARLISP
ncbi:hypothetical protein [Pedosphaera parvula]|uniref:hypothetical protein n=1 Tax=Pedosphaera parvula TaxID=1032527 RepID=UPI00058FA0E9|nr:hypothetical protein [Pedosphaera parvula]